MKSADVVIIGGGMVGLSTAYQLARKGVQTRLFQAGDLGGGTSSANAGKAQVSERPLDALNLHIIRQGLMRFDTLEEELGTQFEWHRLDISDMLTLMRHPALSWQVLESWLVLKKFRVPVYWNWQIEKAMGEDRLEALQIFNKQDPGEKKIIAVDMLCSGYGFLPANQLAVQAGCDHHIAFPGDGILLTHGE